MIGDYVFCARDHSKLRRLGDDLDEPATDDEAGSLSDASAEERKSASIEEKKKEPRLRRRGGGSLLCPIASSSLASAEFVHACILMSKGGIFVVIYHKVPHLIYP